MHLVYAVKHNRWHKAQLVENGHLTNTQLDNVYYDVASLQQSSFIVFTIELNDLKLQATNIRNAYLVITTGPKFKKLMRYVWEIHKVLYRL